MNGTNNSKTQLEIPNYKLFTKNIVTRKKKNPLKGIKNSSINYKNIELLKMFITEEKGKILSSRLSGVSSRNQRKISRAIKQARQLLLLP
jgi:small subunit ribosomal protein S18